MDQTQRSSPWGARCALFVVAAVTVGVTTVERVGAEVVFEQVGGDIDGEAPGDRSGIVSLSADGNRVAVGAPGNGDGVEFSGHVRVFEWSGGGSTWGQLGADVDGPGGFPGFGSLFGGAVSLSADGLRFAAGAQNVGAADGSGPGRLGVYEWSGSLWGQIGGDIDGEGEGSFGRAVALSADGNRVAGGAPVYPTFLAPRGYAAAFELSEPGAAWSPLGPLYVGAEGELMGTSVSLSGNGSRLAVSSGVRAQVYEWDDAGSAWVQVGAEFEGGVDEWLRSVDLSGDGTRLAITATDSAGDASVRVYDLDEASSTWVPVGVGIQAEVLGARFAEAIAMSDDGSRIAVGAPGAVAPVGEQPAGGDPGHAYLYEWDIGTGQWAQIGTGIEGEAADDSFGESVSLSADGSRLAVGGTGNDGNGSDSGHVRVYLVRTPPPAATSPSVGDTLPPTGNSRLLLIATSASVLTVLGLVLRILAPRAPNPTAPRQRPR